jgi:hypothetical protein
VHLGCLYNWDTQATASAALPWLSIPVDGNYIAGPALRNLDRFVVQAVDPNSGEVLAEATEEPLPVPDDPNAVIRVDTRGHPGRRHA